MLYGKQFYFFSFIIHTIHSLDTSNAKLVEPYKLTIIVDAHSGMDHLAPLELKHHQVLSEMIKSAR